MFGHIILSILGIFDHFEFGIIDYQNYIHIYILHRYLNGFEDMGYTTARYLKKILSVGLSDFDYSPHLSRAMNTRV